MFNFDLLNEAVFDVELTDKEFRLLYVIANNAAKNNTNTVQLHNGWLMDKLNCCERQVRRLTNGLNEKGYLIKSVSGTSKNKNANNYTLERTLQADKNVPPKTNENIEKIEDKPQYDDITGDKNVDKNVPLKNNKKIKENINNLSTIDMKDLGPKVNEIEKENKKEKVNEMKNAVLNEMERKDNETLTSTSGEKNTNFNVKEPVYGNLTDELFDEIFGLSSTEVDDDTTGDKVTETENEMSDKGTSVMKHKDNETLTSTSDDQNKNEVKVSIPKVKPSSSGDGESAQSSTDEWDSAVFGTPPVEEDLHISIGISNNCAGHALTPQMEQLPTNHIKMQPDAKEVAKTEREAKIASIMTTSTQGNDITSNSGNDEHKVQSDKVASNCSIFRENCPRNLTPPNSALPPLSLNAAGDVETRSVEQLPTREDKNAPEGLKTSNNAYNLQEWMTKYNKIILEVENTDVEDGYFDTLLDEGCKLFENFPTNEGNYKRQMQDLRYWVARKVDFQKSFKISERWNKYYRAA